MSFALWRQDDHGHRFLIGRFPTLAAAEQRLTALTRLLHKQTYWIEPSSPAQEPPEKA